MLTDFKQGFTDEDAGRMRRLLEAFRSGEFKAPEAAVIAEVSEWVEHVKPEEEG